MPICRPRLRAFPLSCGEKSLKASALAWQLLEHIRITLWDMYEFCRNPRHKSPEWPEGYWPKTPAPPNEAAWKHSIEAINETLEGMRKLITDPKHDLLAPLPEGSGQTLFREALLIADHNAYHLGQLVLVRRRWMRGRDRVWLSKRQCGLAQMLL